MFLNGRQAKVTPDRVTPTVPMHNSFKALTQDKADRFESGSRGGFAMRPTRSKQIWVLKRVQAQTTIQPKPVMVGRFRRRTKEKEKKPEIQAPDVIP